MASAAQWVRLGAVRARVRVPVAAHLVPTGYLPRDTAALGQERLRHLQWLMRKDELRQDVFLVGLPGSERRELALQYCELTQREVEYATLSRDTTEADLKQRRELRAGTAVYSDQAAVRAALHGRVLLLEGFEKAERNLLPILNNLLENREMHLEDGRFLVAPERYAALAREFSDAELAARHLLPVHPDFQVVALGLPVPPLAGNPLDPPLRSRLQARRVVTEGYDSILELLTQAAPKVAAQRDNPLVGLASFASALHAMNGDKALQGSFKTGTARLPTLSADALRFLARSLEAMPDANVLSILRAAYPIDSYLAPEQQKVVRELLARFELGGGRSHQMRPLATLQLTPGAHPHEAVAMHDPAASVLSLPSGGGPIARLRTELASVESQETVLAGMLLSHAHRDLCLLGPGGVGKSVLVRQLAAFLGYSPINVMLYKDMSARDLLQQRHTLSNGDTTWRHSPLVVAALHGGMVVLDGIHRLHPSTTTVLQRLAQDREVTLSDGTQLLPPAKFDALQARLGLTADELKEQGCAAVHPSFRVVALAETATEASLSKQPWFTEELLSMFAFHPVPLLSSSEEATIIKHSVPTLSAEGRTALLHAAARVRDEASAGVLGNSVRLSTRRLIHIAKRLARFPETSLREELERSCLSHFMPTLARKALQSALDEVAPVIPQAPAANVAASVDLDHLAIRHTAGTDGSPSLTIGTVSFPKAVTSNRTKVPQTVFYENDTHAVVMQEIMRDFQLGEHVLLVGNQGVGKNKVVDRLLQLLEMPREYMQLHRDTTVQSLSQQPTVVQGRLSYDDSPLVRAAKEGSVMVIDEADKAPIHVTCVLKTLVEDGEMLLTDGRRLVPPDFPVGLHPEDTLLRTHPDFRLIFLANRPGFPFLGNDFFASMGDLFSCHAVQNPSPAAELSMLAKYAPRVSVHTLGQLCDAFADLRQQAAEGKLNYPYSMRELVSVARHLDAHPDDGILGAVDNVFDFESFQPEHHAALLTTLKRHGLPLRTGANVRLAATTPLSPSVTLGTLRAGVTGSLSPEPLGMEAPRVWPGHLPAATTAASFLSPRWHSFTEEAFALRLPETSYLQRTVALSAMPDGAVVALQTRPWALSIVARDRHSVRTYDLREVGRLPAPDAPPPAAVLVQRPERAPEVLLLNVAPEEGAVLVDPASGGVTELTLQDGRLLERFARGLPRALALRRRAAAGWAAAANSALGDRYILLLPAPVPAAKGSDATWDTTEPASSAPSEALILDLHTLAAYRVPLPTGMSPARTTASALDDARFLLAPAAGVGALSNTAAAAVLTVTPGASGPVVTLTPLVLAAEAGSSETVAPIQGLCAVGRAPLSQADAPADAVVTLVNAHGQCLTAHPHLSESPLLLLDAAAPALGRKVSSVSCGADAVATAHHPLASPAAAPGQQTTQPSEDGDHASGVVRVVDVRAHEAVLVPVSSASLRDPDGESASGAELTALVAAAAALRRAGSVEHAPRRQVVTSDARGIVRWFDVDGGATHLSPWLAALGQAGAYRDGTTGADAPLRLQHERSGPALDVTAPKHGKVDADNTPHVGGNTWAGGTGGRDTAGLGGKGGPYRLDAGHDVHQLSDAEKAAVPQHVREAAEAMGRQAFADRLQEINMSAHDAEIYGRFSDAVAAEARGLRALLEDLRAKQQERVWLKNQTHGDLDDSKLVDGITGDQAVYRRRGAPDVAPDAAAAPSAGVTAGAAAPLDAQRPKRLRVVMDVSASMYRFNSVDERLQRAMETACMLMEGFATPGAEARLRWDMVGHSGEEVVIPLVAAGAPPANEAERLKVLQRMLAHAQFCLSGDHTLEATRAAVQALEAEEDCDERVVVVLSDANLERYGIPPHLLGDQLLAAPTVNAFVVMIGSLGDQATRMQQALPAGRCYLCMDTAELPSILRQIFVSTMGM